MAAFLILVSPEGVLLCGNDVFYSLITSLNNTSDRSMTNVCLCECEHAVSEVKVKIECDKTEHSDCIAVPHSVCYCII